MTNSCGRCSKWIIKAANYCHHCGAQLGTTFESTSSVLAVDHVQPVRVRSGSAGFFNSDAAKWLIVAFMPATLGGGLAWLNGYESGSGAIVGTIVLAVVGSGLLLARLYFERPSTLQPAPAKNSLTVTLHEPLPSGWRTYLDHFQDDSISVEDLQIVARGVVDRGANFSRESMVKAGLSQPKARRVQAEFLRLNYACSLPNGKPGYCLTMRGRRVLASLLS